MDGGAAELFPHLSLCRGNEEGTVPACGAACVYLLGEVGWPLWVLRYPQSPLCAFFPLLKEVALCITSLEFGFCQTFFPTAAKYQYLPFLADLFPPS